MRKLCLNCYRVGKGKHYLWTGNIYVAFLEFFAVIFFLFEGLSGNLNIYKTILAIALLLFGINNLVSYYKGGIICPYCKDGKMIPLDTPRAQEFIKEHNLTVPTSTLPETTPNPK